MAAKPPSMIPMPPMEPLQKTLGGARSPGPEWSHEWPPFSSKHRQRLSRPPMPDRQRSGMLDEEEDTKNIDLARLNRGDLMKVLKDIRDGFAQIKLLQTSFRYRTDGTLNLVPHHEESAKYRIDNDTLEMKDGSARAAYEESNALRIATDRKIHKINKARARQLQAQAAGDVYKMEDDRFRILAPSGYAYNPSYSTTMRAGIKKFCYECGSRLEMASTEGLCGTCVAKENALAEMEAVLQNIKLQDVTSVPSGENLRVEIGEQEGIPSLMVSTPEEERGEDDMLLLDDGEGSDYASTTASTLSDNAIPDATVANAPVDAVEPVIVGSVPTEELPVPVDITEPTVKEENVKNYF